MMEEMDAALQEINEVKAEQENPAEGGRRAAVSRRKDSKRE